MNNTILFPYFLKILVIKKVKIEENLILPSGKYQKITRIGAERFNESELEVLKQEIMKYRLMHHYIILESAIIRTINLNGEIYSFNPDKTKIILYTSINDAFMLQNEIGVIPSKDYIMKIFMKYLVEEEVIIDFDHYFSLFFNENSKSYTIGENEFPVFDFSQIKIYNIMNKKLIVNIKR